MTDSNGWEKAILGRLDAMESAMKSTNDKLSQALIEIATLKVKAGIWGAISASMPVGIGIAIQIIILANK